MTRRGLALGLLVALAVTGAGSAGCKGRSTEVAELDRILSGSAERADGDLGADQGAGAWKPAAAGARFSAGQAVRTSADGGAHLRFLAGGGLRMGASTTIRFGGSGRIAATGTLTAEGATPLLDLELGRARISPGSRVKITRVGGRVRFDVLVGSAVVNHAGEQVKVTAGSALDIEVGSARVRRVASRESRRDASASRSPPPSAGADAGAGRDAGDASPGDTDAGAAPAPDAVVDAEVRGHSGRLRLAGAGGFRPLEPGHHGLEPGSEIEVPAGGAVTLTRAGQRARVRGPADVIVAPPDAPGALAMTRRGRADLDSSEDSDVSIQVPGGTIVARKSHRGGSRARIDVGGGATHVRALRGVVDVSGKRGGHERLLLGQSGTVNRAGAVDVKGRQPDRADFSLDAGVSATIHDPHPPTALRVRFPGACPGPAVLEIARGDSFRRQRTMVQGTGAAIVALPAGHHRYRVRCMGDSGEVADAAVAEGRLRVRRDSGTRPLPRTAPHNTVDADGRRYTVLYQNRLPAITFRWPEAPAADSYQLTVRPARGKTLTERGARARRTLASGRLSEGEYQYWFEAGGKAGGKASPHSTLHIDFDNAAPSGYLQSPRPGARWNGDTVLVSGATIQGWTVSVGGRTLPLDHQRRFSSPVTRAPDESGIAVEFHHPTRGRQIYLRRARQ